MEAGFFNSLITMTLITGRYSSNIEYISNLCFGKNEVPNIVHLLDWENEKESKKRFLNNLYFAIWR